MRGGYRVIDLKNKSFDIGVGVVHDGIFEAIEETRKPIRFTNIVLEGYELRDCDVIMNSASSSYMGTIIQPLHTYIVKVEDTDVVTISLKE